MNGTLPLRALPLLLLLAGCDALFPEPDFSLSLSGDIEGTFEGDAQIGRQNSIIGSFYELRVAGRDGFDAIVQTAPDFEPLAGEYTLVPLAEGQVAFQLETGVFAGQIRYSRDGSIRELDMTDGVLVLGSCSARGIAGQLRGTAVLTEAPNVQTRFEADFLAPHNFGRSGPRTAENLCP